MRSAALPLALALVACHRPPAQQPPRPSHPQPTAPAMPRPPVDPATLVDAGPLVDLLRLPGAELVVSSTVHNATERPANLVDGDLETAWSSHTDHLEGTTITFRVPTGSRVETVRMTVGMTKVRDAGDLFTMNPRVSRVRVYRDGELLGTMALDPTVRTLQGIGVHQGGGTYRVVVDHVEPGSRADWREVSVSEFEVLGRPAPGAPTQPERPPAVRVDAFYGAELPTVLPSLPDGHPIAPTCLAWCPASHQAVCAVGGWGNNDAAAQALTAVLVPSADRASDVALFEAPDGGGAAMPFETEPPPPRALAALRALLGRQGCVALAPLATELAPGDELESNGFTARFARRQTHSGAHSDNDADLYNDRIEVRLRAGGPFTTLEERTNEPCGGSTATVAAVPGGRWFVVASVRNVGAEGVSGSSSRAWVCDAVAQRCDEAVGPEVQE